MNRVLVVAAIAGLLCAARVEGAFEPNLDRGFDPEKLYQFGDVDQVNLQSGMLSINLPIGQRFPIGYGNAWTYNQIPYDLRNRYGFDPNFRYYYGDGYLYRVDPRTMLISQVVSAILR